MRTITIIFIFFASLITFGWVALDVLAPDSSLWQVINSFGAIFLSGIFTEWADNHLPDF